jgi:hypothetical protein
MCVVVVVTYVMCIVDENLRGKMTENIYQKPDRKSDLDRPKKSFRSRADDDGFCHKNLFCCLLFFGFQNSSRLVVNRVARWFDLKPEIPIWVNSEIFYDHMEYFVDIWDFL